MSGKNDDNIRYSNYSAEDLILDEYFIISIIKPTKKSESFWRRTLQDKIVSHEDYDLASYLIESLQVHNELISWNEIDELWSEINKSNSICNEEQKTVYTRRFLFWSLSAVASILLLFLFVTLIKKDPEAVRSSIENVKVPEKLTKDIQLIFADDEAMVLEGHDAEIKYDGRIIAINKDTKIRKKQSVSEETVPYNQLIVPKGKRSTLMFEDGSKIWVNAGTRVVYPVTFSAKERELYVDGEIYLDVSRDESRPFIVKTKDFTVSVLGTSFNVMAYESDNVREIVLVKGSVIVSDENKKETKLSANEMFLSENGNSSVKEVNASNYVSWTMGVYMHESERMEAILKRLSRYYGEKIMCEPGVAQLKCSGKLDLKDDLSLVLKGITQTAPVGFKIEDGIYIITNK
ncbi:MAG: FecR domain-containing protein [Tannerella sp.]|jgi:hypothetical protein|nr:FecR domain-containing protein [Tannerella sp.]